MSGNCLFQPLQSPRRSTNIRHLELLASALVVRDEELLHLVQDGRVEFVNRATVLMTVRMNGHCDQAVILRALAIFGLCRLHDPNEPRRKHTAYVGGFIHQDHHIERISVFSSCRRHKSKVEWEAKSLCKQASQRESFDLRIVIELVTA